MKRCNGCCRDLPLDKFRMDVPKGRRLAKCRECENARKRLKNSGRAIPYTAGPVMASELDQKDEPIVFLTRCTLCGASDGFMCRSADESMVLPHSARIRDALAKRRT